MSDTPQDTLAELVQSLRRIQSASEVLAETLARLSEEPAADEGKQMERLGGVAYLMGLISQQVEGAHMMLLNEITPR
jgi:hypothetical protein